MKKFVFLFLSVAMTGLTSSCLYTDVRTPGWYYSQNYGDVKGLQTVGRLSGEACARSFVWAVYTGDESFDAAVQNAINGKADMLYDVKTDYFTESYVFSLYFKKCTRVSGLGVKLNPSLINEGKAP